MWPVILRELRAGSRRWTTYWLRLLAAFAVVVTIAWWLSTPKIVFVRQPGGEVFLQMHRVILAAIWIVVPLMTADCLSREKREGTLGLLFLTNLRAWNIVFAKAIATGLTALTLWLSVIPVITVPVLLGGLPASEIVLSCSLVLGSICLALAAGMIASAASRRISGAVAIAIVFSFVGHLIFSVLVTELGQWLPAFPFRIPNVSDSETPIAAGFFIIWNLYLSEALVGLATTSRTATPITLPVMLIPILSFLISCTVALLAAFIIHRNWQDKPQTKRQTEVEKFFCAPVFLTGLFRWWMRRSLDRNPIGWLEKRSWNGRIAAWIWLAIMISFASALAYSAASRTDFEGYNVLMWMLLVSIAYVAAGSFRRERETGALELILVTPLSERQVILGRLRGLWNQFLPTFAIWIAVVLYLSSALKDWQVASLIRFTVAYFVVPVVGLYFSLRSRFVLLSWFATLAACFALPQMLWWPLHIYLDELQMGADPFLRFRQPFLIGAQLALAALLLWRLRTNLVRRSFSLR